MQANTVSEQSEGGYPKPESAKGFKGPVRWLLGPQVIASLKATALYMAFKGKLDLRDWMRARAIRLDEQSRFNSAEEASTDEYWFDYFADTGDGQMAMYGIAYLCLSNLSVEANARVGSKVGLSDPSKPMPNSMMRLPRGEFLFVGGDTAYLQADYPTLALRFQAPFVWAYNDLNPEAKAVDHKLLRPIFGIPGNHDYYDLIDGFGRQFLEPTSDDGTPNREGLKPQLSIPGFKRCQNASYVALQLPFDWWMWGLDNEMGRLDIRQQEFFKGLTPKRPDKLIVATPEPSTAFGRCARLNEKVPKAFADLNLEQPFLTDIELPPGTCRLDLSGDTHQYTRYWGPSANGSGSPPAAENYASVVSGLGGAFLHPSDTDVGEIEEQIKYPREEVARVETARRLFSPVNIISGGYVAIFGALAAAIVFFGATVPASSRVVVEKLFDVLRVALPKLFRPAGLFPEIRWPEQTLAQAASLSPLEIALRVLLLIASVVLIAASVQQSKSMIDSAQNEKDGFRRYRVRVAVLIVAGVACLIFGMWRLVEFRENLSPFQCSLMILFSLLWSANAVAASLVYSEWLFKRAYNEIVKWWRYWPVILLVVLAAAFPVLGFTFFGRYPAQYVFADVLFALVVLGGAAGIMLGAFVVGGSLHGGAGKAAFLVLGAWHALLQGGVPFLLARRGDWRSWVAAVAAVLVFWLAGNWLVAKLKFRQSLLVVWLVYGVVLLGLPFFFYGEPARYLDTWTARFVVAVLLGGLMSCVSLGWYFAVSLAFNGHNEQAGGAARIERFKEFMRVRLTAQGLTVYVIGFDEPKIDGKDLDLKIIDVFELKV
ncbi:MAG: hypothetical protein AABN34_01995 [Acidobacteriota bacterium]